MIKKALFFVVIFFAFINLLTARNSHTVEKFQDTNTKYFKECFHNSFKLMWQQDTCFKLGYRKFIAFFILEHTEIFLKEKESTIKFIFGYPNNISENEKHQKRLHYISDGFCFVEEGINMEIEFIFNDNEEVIDITGSYY